MQKQMVIGDPDKMEMKKLRELYQIREFRLDAAPGLYTMRQMPKWPNHLFRSGGKIVVFELPDNVNMPAYGTRGGYIRLPVLDLYNVTVTQCELEPGLICFVNALGNEMFETITQVL